MSTTNRCRSAPVVRLVGWDAASAAVERISASGPEWTASSVARCIAPAAAVTSGLICQLAAAAPGDLDPTFGNVGRAHPLPGLWGPAWSVEVHDDEYLIAGGDSAHCGSYYYYYYYDCYLSNFSGRLTADGAIDTTFAPADIADTEVLAMAVQPDGKLVAVGRSVLGDSGHPMVFRLNPNGSLDSTFGDGGIVRTDAAGESATAESIVLEPDGRITIAGTIASSVFVLRLLPTGALDPSFGVDGVFSQYVASVFVAPARIIRVADGGYRVIVHGTITAPFDPSSGPCTVLALTSEGAIDAGFGTAGTAIVPGASGGPLACTSIAAQADGRLLLAGSEGERAFAARLHANGIADGTFSGMDVSGLMTTATAMAVGPDDSIVLAGHDAGGLTGSLVVRLLANGHLDPTFGIAGSAWLDLTSDYGDPEVKDIEVLPDGALLLAGSEGRESGGPFVARLLGDGAGGGPGVLGVTAASIEALEPDGRAVVTVRRVGGSTGAVSVDWSTRNFLGEGWADPGDDFTAAQGRLEWADGDVGEREIVVPISAGGAAPEGPEQFDVVLANPTGLAGLGSANARVVIRGDGYPSGLITIVGQQMVVEEGKEIVTFEVRRDSYASGRVSVTVRLADGTATFAEDYSAASGSTGSELVLTWEDNDMSARALAVSSLADKRNEPDETFTVSLTSPTGGAVLGPQVTATATIVDNDDSGGGGALGGLGTLMLVVGAALRRAVHRA